MRTRAAVLVAWSRAARMHACTLDEAIAEIDGDDELVTFNRAGITVSTRDALVDLAACTGPIDLALPVPGDVRGLPGAGPWTALALDTGEAVVTGVEVLVPVIEAHGNDVEGYSTFTRWEIFAREVSATQAMPRAGLSEADRELRLALTNAVDLLAAVDVARWSPELAEAVADIRSQRRGVDHFASTLPRSYGPHARELLARARVVERIIEAALSIETTLLDSASTLERNRALAGVAASVRASICAALNEGDHEWTTERARLQTNDPAQAQQ